jgi:hypothetical protein
MKKQKQALQLGAPDPERKTSPVAWETDEDTDSLRESVPDEAVCLFNDTSYDHGTVIESGSSRLRCEHGIWVPVGPTAESKP